jgi:MFS family permease
MEGSVEGFDAGFVATLLAAQTMGNAVGKVGGGFLVDSVGGTRAVVLSTIVMAFCLTGMSSAATAHQVMVTAAIMELVGSPVWPAHAVIIRGWFPSARLSDAFWVLSMASRGADMGSKAFYGVLQGFMDWRQCLQVASVLCISNCLLTLAKHSDVHQGRAVEADRYSRVEVVDGSGRPTDSDGTGGSDGDGSSTDTCAEKDVIENEKGALRTGFDILTDRRFLISTSGLALHTLTKRAGQLMPVYFFATAQGALSKGQAASIGLVFSAGIFVSILVFGRLYGRIGPVAKVRLCAWLTTGSVAAALALSQMEDGPGSRVGMRAALVFCFAAGIGVSYYVVPGVFSVRFGGRSTGVVSAFQDFVSMGLSAVFLQLVVRPLLSTPEAGWSAVWAVCAAIAAIGSGVTVMAQRQLHIEGLGSGGPGTDRCCASAQRRLTRRGTPRANTDGTHSGSPARKASKTEGSPWSWWWLLPGTTVNFQAPVRYMELANTQDHES